jgi:hypothetical protein
MFRKDMAFTPAKLIAKLSCIICTVISIEFRISWIKMSKAIRAGAPQTHMLWSPEFQASDMQASDMSESGYSYQVRTAYREAERQAETQILSPQDYYPGAEHIQLHGLSIG